MRNGRRSFADWLQRAMTERGLRIIDLARRVGVSPTAVQYWLKGDTEPNEDNIHKLGRVLGSSREEIHRLLGHIEPTGQRDEMLTELVSIYRALNDEGRRNAIYMLRGLQEHGEAGDTG